MSPEALPPFNKALGSSSQTLSMSKAVSGSISRIYIHLMEFLDPAFRELQEPVCLLIWKSHKIKLQGKFWLSGEPILSYGLEASANHMLRTRAASPFKLYSPLLPCPHWRQYPLNEFMVFESFFFFLRDYQNQFDFGRGQLKTEGRRQTWTAPRKSWEMVLFVFSWKILWVVTTRQMQVNKRPSLQGDDPSFANCSHSLISCELHGQDAQLHKQWETVAGWPSYRSPVGTCFAEEPQIRTE